MDTLTPETMPAVYSLTKVDNQFALAKSGNICRCPFRAPVLVPGKLLNSAAIEVPVCGNACQFFNVYEHRNNAGETLTEVFFDCTNSSKMITK